MGWAGFGEDCVARASHHKCPTEKSVVHVVLAVWGVLAGRPFKLAARSVHRVSFGVMFEAIWCAIVY